MISAGVCEQAVTIPSPEQGKGLRLLVDFHPFDKSLDLKCSEGLLQLIGMVRGQRGEDHRSDGGGVSSKEFEGASRRIFNKVEKSTGSCSEAGLEKDSRRSSFLGKFAEASEIDRVPGEEGFSLCEQGRGEEERFTLFLAKFCFDRL